MVKLKANYGLKAAKFFRITCTRCDVLWFSLFM